MTSDAVEHPIHPWALEAPKGREALSFPLSKQFPSQTVNSCIALYLTWNRWIPRKTYRFTFLDTETIAHRIRWELELPPGLPVLPGSDQFLLPLAIFSRDVPLVATKLTDETGREAPLLTSSETEGLTRQMLGEIKDSNTQLAHRLFRREVLGEDAFLKRGDRGFAVRRLRSALRLTGTSDEFDDGVEEAVRCFQRDEDLTVDGIVGSQTAAVMMGEADKKRSLLSILGEEGSLMIGDESIAVKRLRLLLNLPGNSFRFDGALQNVVRAFQKANGLKVTGSVNQDTAAAIDSKSVGPLTDHQRAWLPGQDSGFLQTVLMTDPTRLRRSLTLEYETAYEAPERVSFLARDTLLKLLNRELPESEGDLSPLRLASSRLSVTWLMSGLGDAGRSRIECEAPDELEIEAVSGCWITPDKEQGANFPNESEAPYSALPIRAEATSSRAYFLPEDTRQVGSVPVGDTNYSRIAIQEPLEDSMSTWRDQPGFDRRKNSHLWATWRDQPAFVTVLIRPRWQDLRDSFIGLGFGSVILLIAAALTLISSVLVDPELIPLRVNKTPLAAVVAFTASIATSILIRPDSNEMAGLLLRPIRLRLAVLGLLPVLAAITIAIPVEPWINGIILLVLAGVELWYTQWCRTRLRVDGLPEVTAFENVDSRVWEAPIRVVRNTEAFRRFDFEGEHEEEENPLTDRGLIGAAQGFADSAGWSPDGAPRQ